MSGQLRTQPSREVAIPPDFPELMRGIDGILWEADAKTFVFSYVSLKTRSMLGYEPEEWYASPTFWADHLHPADRDWAVNFCVAQTGQALDHEFEYRMLAKDGRVVWVRDLVWVVRDAEGQAVKLRGLLTDISARKTAEQRLAMQQECATLLALAGNVDKALPSLLHGVASRMGWATAAWWPVAGAHLDATATWTVMPSFAPYSTAARATRLALGEGIVGRAAQNGAVEWISDMRTAPDGLMSSAAQEAGVQAIVAIPVQGSHGVLGVLEFGAASPQPWHADDLAALRAIGAQVGLFLEREHAQNELRAREIEHVRETEAARSRLDALIASVPGVVWEAWGAPDASQQRIDFVSEHVERLLGYTRAEWLATPNFWLSIVHPADRTAAARTSAAHFESGVGGTLEFRWMRKDGDAVWVQAWNVIIKDADGRPVGMRGVTMDISTRKVAQIELERTRRDMELILEAAGEGVYGVDENGVTTFMNAAALRMTGLTLEQAVGHKLHSVIHHSHTDGSHYPAEDCPIYKAAHGAPMAQCMDDVFFRIDGTSFPVEYVTSPMFDDGKPAGAVTIFKDITQRRATERALENERKLFTTVLEQLPAGSILAEMPTGKLIMANRRVNEILGHDFRPADGIEQYAAYRISHPDGRPMEPEDYPMTKAVQKGETIIAQELLYHRADGSSVPLLVNAAPVRDAKDEIIAGVATFVDIRERKRAEEELRLQRNILSWQRRVLGSIATGAPLPDTLDILCREAQTYSPGQHFSVLLTDEKGTHLRHGAAPSLPDHYCKAVDGISVGEGVGSCGTAAHRKEAVIVSDIEHDPLWKEFKALALPIGLRACWSTPIVGAEGRLLGTWAVYSEKVGDPTPRDTAMINVATKLAAIAIERSDSEAEVRYQRDLVSTITDNAGSALFMMDAKGLPMFLNDAAKAMTGYESIDEIKGRPLHYAVHFRKPDGSDYPMEECPLDRANAEIRDLKNQREMFVRKDGSLFPVAFNLAVVERDGKPLGAVIEVRDITEELRAEQELRQRAEELTQLADALQRSNAELDQFAYVTSHDLKAPLRGISNLSRWIEEDLADRLTPESANHLDLLRGRVKRMEALIDAILEYSRIGRTKQPNERVDVGKLVSETLDLIAPPATLRFDVAPDLPALITQRARLQQVFMNLIGNAVKHHDKANGVIRIGAKDLGEEWEFSVEDDGPGIAPRFHEKIFVIFQTLQPRDKVEGTGIGLALVKKVIEHQGGTIRLDSEEGKGAAFRFTWPKKRHEASS